MASFACATSSTAKSRKPNRDLAEPRGNQMVPIIFHPADQTTASAIGSPNGMASGLRGNDLLLNACQQQLPFGQGQTEVGEITEIIGSVDRHHIGGLVLTVSPGFHQPQNPSHASTPGQRSGHENTASALTPQSPGSPGKKPLR